MTDDTALTAPETTRSELTQESLTFDADRLESMQRMAEVMASAKVTVPRHLSGSPGDCLAVIMQAAQWRMNPYAVSQKTYLVNGQLGYEAQLVNAVVSSSRLIQGRLDYIFEGWKGDIKGKADCSDENAVTVIGQLRGEKHQRPLRVSMAQVGKVRNSPLWESDPRQQLAYLATKRWARLHAPDVLMGVYTPDELEGTESSVEKDVTPADVVPIKPPTRTEQVKKKLADKTDRKVVSGGGIKPPVSNIDDVTLVSAEQLINFINNTKTLDELQAAADEAAMLKDDADKNQVRKAWAARKSFLERQAQD